MQIDNLAMASPLPLQQQGWQSGTASPARDFESTQSNSRRPRKLPGSGRVSSSDPLAGLSLGPTLVLPSQQQQQQQQQQQARSRSSSRAREPAGLGVSVISDTSRLKELVQVYRDMMSAANDTKDASEVHIGNVAVGGGRVVNGNYALGLGAVNTFAKATFDHDDKTKLYLGNETKGASVMHNGDVLEWEGGELSHTPQNPRKARYIGNSHDGMDREDGAGGIFNGIYLVDHSSMNSLRRSRNA